MNHTPGPWKVIKSQHGQPTRYLCVQIGTDDTYTTLEMLPADARLVAAAPDLLAACQTALHWLNQHPEPSAIPIENVIEAAIAKAQGDHP